MITTMKNKTSNTNLKAIFTNAHNKASTIAKTNTSPCPENLTGAIPWITINKAFHPFCEYLLLNHHAAYIEITHGIYLNCHWDENAEFPARITYAIELAKAINAEFPELSIQVVHTEIYYQTYTPEFTKTIHFAIPQIPHTIVPHTHTIA